ncbi:hypothetical protein B0O80DRAFT_5964 [Mortierella sp. GBAus27b]|nr:hypothetical protein B0O80DRAFT_5964 [Mortierella sp. GBAus27b]
MDNPSLGLPHTQAQVEDHHLADWLDVDALSGPDPAPCGADMSDLPCTESGPQFFFTSVDTLVPELTGYPSSADTRAPSMPLPPILDEPRSADAGGTQQLMTPMDAGIFDNIALNSILGRPLGPLVLQAPYPSLLLDSLQTLISGFQQQLPIMDQQTRESLSNTHLAQHQLHLSQGMVGCSAIHSLQYQSTGLLNNMQDPVLLGAAELQVNPVPVGQSTNPEQRILDLLFTPTLAPRSLSKSLSYETSFAVDREHNMGRHSQDDPLSNNSNTSNTRSKDVSIRKTNSKRTHKEAEHLDETDSDNQTKAKRPRKALQLQKRLEIIEFWESNQDIPVAELSKKFNVPRTTIYGIINSKEVLKNVAKSRPCGGISIERYSRIESRFRILEEFLVLWLLDVETHGFAITNHKIMRWALTFHELISRFMSTPLPE